MHVGELSHRFGSSLLRRLEFDFELTSGQAFLSGFWMSARPLGMGRTVVEVFQCQPLFVHLSFELFSVSSKLGSVAFELVQFSSPLTVSTGQSCILTKLPSCAIVANRELTRAILISS